MDILHDVGEQVIYTLTPAGGGDGEDDDFLRRADGALPETSRGERSDDGRVGDMVAAVELHIRARRSEGRLAQAFLDAGAVQRLLWVVVAYGAAMLEGFVKAHSGGSIGI